MRTSLYTLRSFQAALVLGRLLPRRLFHFLGLLLGRRAAPPGSPVFEILRANLRAVTGLEAGPLERLCLRNLDEFSHTLADYFLFSSRPPAYAQRLLAEWSGWEHLAAAREAGRGILLVTGHLGHWELGGALLSARGLPMTIITLDEPSTELTRWRDAYRQRLGIKTIAVGPGREFAFVEMIATLRRNECLAMLVDRPYAGTGLPVRFFDETVEFSSAAALLWQHTGAAVIAAFVTRGAGGRYTSWAEPPVPLAALPDKRTALVANTQRIASVFETIIRRFPEQWFNYAPAFPAPPLDPAPPAPPTAR